MVGADRFQSCDFAIDRLVSVSERRRELNCEYKQYRKLLLPGIPVQIQSGKVLFSNHSILSNGLDPLFHFAHESLKV